MRYNFSFSVTDEKLAAAIKSFRDNGGNLSKLVCNLLEQYFFGDNNKEVITKEMMLLIEIKKRLDEFEQWRQEIIPKIQELEERLKQKQEEKEIEDNLPLLRELREFVFTDDLAKTPEEFFSRFAGDEKELRRVVKVILSNWAAEKGISYPQAVKLFFKAFPELKEKLEGRL